MTKDGTALPPVDRQMVHALFLDEYEVLAAGMERLQRDETTTAPKMRAKMREQLLELLRADPFPTNAGTRLPRHEHVHYRRLNRAAAAAEAQLAT